MTSILFQVDVFFLCCRCLAPTFQASDQENSLEKSKLAFFPLKAQKVRILRLSWKLYQITAAFFMNLL